MACAALLMMWYVAWKQVPCGSFPADEDVIRAKCRVPASRWDDLRPILMRGWWRADDGRLYHDTVVERVREMIAYRQKEADRRNRNRRAAGGVPDGLPPGDGGTSEYETPHFPELSRGTTTEHRRESDGTPDTGTGTGTSLSPPFVAEDQKSSTHRGARVSKNPKPGSGGGEVAVPTAAEVFGARLLAAAVDRAGVGPVSPDDGRLLELARAQVLPDELEAALRAAVKARAEHPLPWAVARIGAQRREAAAVAIAGAPGPTLDPDSKEAIEADGVRFGIGRWVQVDAAGKTVPWPVYKARVVKARGAESVRVAGVA